MLFTGCSFSLLLNTPQERRWVYDWVHGPECEELWESAGEDWDGPRFETAFIDGAGSFIGPSFYDNATAVTVYGDNVDADQVTWFTSRFLAEHDRDDKVVVDFGFWTDNVSDQDGYGGSSVVVTAAREAWFSPSRAARAYAEDGVREFAPLVIDRRDGLGRLAGIVAGTDDDDD